MNARDSGQREAELGWGHRVRAAWNRQASATVRHMLHSMHNARVRRPATRVAVIVGLVAIGIGGSGCAAPAVQADHTPNATVAVTESPTPGPVVDSALVTDAESCEAYVDVLTILHNANTALYEDRMSKQEYDGWMRLATRVLDRIPTRGEGAVSDAIAALKQASPTVKAGAMGSTDLGTPESSDMTPLADACSEAGFELFSEGFVGG